jgi:hypothetical protein
MGRVPMARRTFDVIDITEILVYWHAGRPKNQIARTLGLHRRTISKYVSPAIAVGLRPCGPPLSDAEWAARVREWFPELADTRLRQVTWPAIAEHHDYIAAQLKADVTMAAIHQRLRDQHGLAVSVASFRRYVAANLAEEARRPQVRVLRPHPVGAGQGSADRLRAAGPLAGSSGRPAARDRPTAAEAACGRIGRVITRPAPEVSEPRTASASTVIDIRWRVRRIHAGAPGTGQLRLRWRGRWKSGRGVDRGRARS